MFPLATRAPLSLVPALMLVRLTDEWYSFLPVGSMVPIRDDLGLTNAQAGVILISLLAGGVFGHVFPIAADFLDRRLIAVFGCALIGGCMIAFALSSSFAALLVAGLAWGAATDAFVHSCEVALVDLAGDDLAPALARVNAYGAVGDLLGPATLIAAAALGIEWRAVFAAGGGLMLLYGVWLMTLRFPPPHPPQHASAPLASVLSVLRDRRVVLLAIIAGLFGILDEPLLAFTLAYLEDVRGLSAQMAITVVGAGVAGGLAGFLMVEHFTSRWSPRVLLLASAITVTAGIALLIALPWPLAQGAAAFAFGYAGALFWSMLHASYLSLLPGQAGSTEAVVSTIGLFAVAVPPAIGAVADAWGLTAGISLYAAIPAAMLLLVVISGAGGDPPASREVDG